MKKLIFLLICLVLVGCGGAVQRAPKELDTQRKLFTLPPEDKAAIYIFRDGFLGSQVNTEIFIDGKILGKNLGSTYLYADVHPGTHMITSHFVGYVSLSIETEGGEIYFVRDVVDTSLLETNLSLVPVDDVTGKAAVQRCKLAESVPMDI